MGGKGSGGARVGTGSKPKSARDAFLHGSRDRGVKRGGTTRGAWVVPVPFADMPDDEQAIWRMEAPHAVAARTLTDASLSAFREFCEVVCERGRLLAQIREQGHTSVEVVVDGAGQEHHKRVKHPLLTEFRSMQQRVEAGRARFALAPLGKPMVVDEEPKDEWAEFDTPVQ